ncbi:MAG TPA: hypothetical protein VFP21_06570 [Solirubrobacterales bacterium]|nr:hypothetical protein [Solirubrobacterales bacterium]
MTPDDFAAAGFDFERVAFAALGLAFDWDFGFDFDDFARFGADRFLVWV